MSRILLLVDDNEVFVGIVKDNLCVVILVEFVCFKFVVVMVDGIVVMSLMFLEYWF